MKLRNKVLAGFVATILCLSMMVGSALAQTHELPFDYPEEADVATNNDVWVVLFGGTAAPPLTDDEALRDSVKSVDIVISGNATFDAEIISNGPSWVGYNYDGQSVDGEMTLTLDYDMEGQGYTEVIVNLQNKSEGPLSVKRMDFKDADGNVVLAHGAASEAAAGGEAAPKTGLVSTALFLGLGAAAFGTGAVILKKKED